MLKIILLLTKSTVPTTHSSRTKNFERPSQVENAQKHIDQIFSLDTIIVSSLIPHRKIMPINLKLKSHLAQQSLFYFIIILCLSSFGTALSKEKNPYATPPEVWKSFDPDAGEFNEEIISESVSGGIYSKESYISAYFLNEEIRVYCKYSVKEGANNAPSLLCVHGMMGAPSVRKSYVQSGWAVMAHDYCGLVGNRKQYTKYPKSLSYAHMERSKRGEDRGEINKPKNTRLHLYHLIQRRVLSYLLSQKEADKSRVGAIGYSVGGSLMWNLGMDSRVDAVVAYFGIGFTKYYRDRRVWMYDKPAVLPEMTESEKMFLTGVSPEAHVPYMSAATLWLNGTNDHHGGHERGCSTFKNFSQGIPWAYALQPRGHHNTDDIQQAEKMWLEKHVLNKEVFWPAQPSSEIRLNSEGIPELQITPAHPEKVKSVKMYYALKEPVSHNRNWRDVNVIREENIWTGKMPVLHVDDYVFGFANVEYDTTLVLSSDFNAVIPSSIGQAVATDTKSDQLSEDLSGWINISKAVGVGGIEGFRSSTNKGCSTDKLADEKWAAPLSSDLLFKFYCTEPQSIQLLTGIYSVNIDITASDQWQEMIISASDMIHTRNGTKNTSSGWDTFKSMKFKPAKDSDITKIIFSGFSWKQKSDK